MAGAEIGLDDGRVGADLVGRALGQHATVAQHRYLGSDLEDDVHVVLDEDQRDLLALPQVVDALDHPPALVGAHAGGRLVEQQDLGIEHQRERDIEQLLVAVREIGRGDSELLGKAEHLGDLLHARVHLSERESAGDVLGLAPVGRDRHEQALLDGKRREDARDLEGATDTRVDDLRPRATDQICAVEGDAARVRPEPAADQIEERALASTVWADDRSERAGRKVERDI